MTEWFELPAVTADDLAVPPTLYAVPATLLPPLDPGTCVTYGIAGVMWAVDEAQVTDGPFVDRAGRECYDITPYADHGAGAARGEVTPDGHAAAQAMTMPTADLWVYREAPARHTLDDLPPATATDWMERVVPDLSGPPPVRRPRPARELPSLQGRRLTVRTVSGRWLPAVAVSEAWEHEGSVVVQVIRPEYYPLALYRVDSFHHDMVATVHLHRAWTY